MDPNLYRNSCTEKKLKAECRTRECLVILDWTSPFVLSFRKKSSIDYKKDSTPFACYSLQSYIEQAVQYLSLPEKSLNYECFRDVFPSQLKPDERKSLGEDLVKYIIDQAFEQTLSLKRAESKRKWFSDLKNKEKLVQEALCTSHKPGNSYDDTSDLLSSDDIDNCMVSNNISVEDLALQKSLLLNEAYKKQRWHCVSKRMKENQTPKKPEDISDLNSSICDKNRVTNSKSILVSPIVGKTQQNDQLNDFITPPLEQLLPLRQASAKQENILIIEKQTAENWDYNKSIKSDLNSICDKNAVTNSKLIFISPIEGKTQENDQLTDFINPPLEQLLPLRQASAKQEDKLIVEKQTGAENLDHNKSVEDLALPKSLLLNQEDKTQTSDCILQPMKENHTPKEPEDISHLNNSIWDIEGKIQENDQLSDLINPPLEQLLPLRQASLKQQDKLIIEKQTAENWESDGFVSSSNVCSTEKSVETPVIDLNEVKSTSDESGDGGIEFNHFQRNPVLFSPQNIFPCLPTRSSQSTRSLQIIPILIDEQIKPKKVKQTISDVIEIDNCYYYLGELKQKAVKRLKKKPVTQKKENCWAK